MNDLPPVKVKKMKRVRSPDRGSSLFEAVDMPEEQYMNERAIMTIIRALDNYSEAPRIDWPDHQKEEVTFSCWALDEILGLVWDHPWTPASETITEFALKLELWTATAVTEEQKRIFAIAAETAWEFLEEIEEVERL